MINTIAPEARVGSNLMAVLYNKNTIKAMAVQLVASQVEAHIDMMADCPDEYRSFVDYDGCIQNATVTVEDYIEDLLTEFRGALYDAVRQVKVTTNSVTLQKDNTDADVTVSIE